MTFPSSAQSRVINRELDTEYLSQNVRMAPYTTWKIGGIARYFYTPRTNNELAAAFHLARRENIPLLILGNGSNVLLPTSGFDGLVIHTSTGFTNLRFGENYVYADAGVSLASLVYWSASTGRNTFNFLTGIPGTVGGALVMNAGSNGHEMSNYTLQLQYIDSTGQIRLERPDQCEFGYRHSLFQKDSHIIMRAKLKLEDSDQTGREKILQTRSSKIPAERTAGCVFKNPPNENWSAGELIDKAGCKGLKVGEARVSTKHANFIVNEGHSSSDHILELIDIIRNRVYKHFGVVLDLEVRVVDN